MAGAAVVAAVAIANHAGNFLFKRRTVFRYQKWFATYSIQ